MSIPASSSRHTYVGDRIGKDDHDCTHTTLRDRNSRCRIAVRDQDKALTFYTGVLGLHKQVDVTLPQLGGRWITLAPPGSATSLALVPASDTNPAGVETGIRLAVGDVPAMRDHLRHHATVGQLLRWESVPTMFAFRDPHGNGLEIVQGV
jgi:catechol 2,3-dioxygenase-like lactoylglutathione lyase family enzyme